MNGLRAGISAAPLMAAARVAAGVTSLTCQFRTLADGATGSMLRADDRLHPIDSEATAVGGESVEVAFVDGAGGESAATR
jgi:hypothetical protein